MDNSETGVGVGMGGIGPVPWGAAICVSSVEGSGSISGGIILLVSIVDADCPFFLRGLTSSS